MTAPMTREELIGELEVWPATGRGDGLDAAVVSRLMKRAAEALRGVAQTSGGAKERHDLAVKIDTWAPQSKPLILIALERRLIVDALHHRNAQQPVTALQETLIGGPQHEAVRRLQGLQETRGDEPVAGPCPYEDSGSCILEEHSIGPCLCAAPQQSPRLERAPAYCGDPRKIEVSMAAWDGIVHYIKALHKERAVDDAKMQRAAYFPIEHCMTLWGITPYKIQHDTTVVSSTLPLEEATAAQHFLLRKGEPARFVRNGELKICQCRECQLVSSNHPRQEPT